MLPLNESTRQKATCCTSIFPARYKLFLASWGCAQLFWRILSIRLKNILLQIFNNSNPKNVKNLSKKEIFTNIWDENNQQQLQFWPSCPQIFFCCTPSCTISSKNHQNQGRNDKIIGFLDQSVNHLARKE